MSSVAFLCGMPHGAVGPGRGVEIPNLMTSAARAGPEVATTSAAVKRATKTSATRCFMAITSPCWSASPGRSESQVGLFHTLVAQEVLRLALHHELPRL